jgi:hypothetical protein
MVAVVKAREHSDPSGIIFAMGMCSPMVKEISGSIALPSGALLAQ